MTLDLSFQARCHDRDGDLVHSGVFLHVDHRVILRFEDPDELEEFARQIQAMLSEIREAMHG